MAQFSKGNDTRRRADDALDLDALLHPAQAFAHPLDVVRDRDLTFNEKRAILASWASDACAVEAAPALRQTPQGRAIAFDDIMDALRILDREAAECPRRITGVCSPTGSRVCSGESRAARPRMTARARSTESDPVRRMEIEMRIEGPDRGRLLAMTGFWLSVLFILAIVAK